MALKVVPKWTLSKTIQDLQLAREKVTKGVPSPLGRQSKKASKLVEIVRNMKFKPPK